MTERHAYAVHMEKKIYKYNYVLLLKCYNSRCSPEASSYSLGVCLILDTVLKQGATSALRKLRLLRFLFVIIKQHTPNIIIRNAQNKYFTIRQTNNKLFATRIKARIVLKSIQLLVFHLNLGWLILAIVS